MHKCMHACTHVRVAGAFALALMCLGDLSYTHPDKHTHTYTHMHTFFLRNEAAPNTSDLSNIHLYKHTHTCIHSHCRMKPRQIHQIYLRHTQKNIHAHTHTCKYSYCRMKPRQIHQTHPCQHPWWSTHQVTVARCQLHLSVSSTTLWRSARDHARLCIPQRGADLEQIIIIIMLIIVMVGQVVLARTRSRGQLHRQ
jgi:hypothetical protein